MSKEAVRRPYLAFLEGWNKRDAHAEALCYTEDGDFRSSAGPFVSGRAAIEKQLTVNDPSYFFNLEVTKSALLPNLSMNAGYSGSGQGQCTKGEDGVLQHGSPENSHLTASRTARRAGSGTSASGTIGLSGTLPALTSLYQSSW